MTTRPTSGATDRRRCWRRTTPTPARSQRQSARPRASPTTPWRSGAPCSSTGGAKRSSCARAART
eukprot:6401595-Alexandrium_andersonii.AAC.1